MVGYDVGCGVTVHFFPGLTEFLKAVDADPGTRTQHEVAEEKGGGSDADFVAAFLRA